MPALAFDAKISASDKEDVRRSIRERIPKDVRRWMMAKDRVPQGSGEAPSERQMGHSGRAYDRPSEVGVREGTARPARPGPAAQARVPFSWIPLLGMQEKYQKNLAGRSPP